MKYIVTEAHQINPITEIFLAKVRLMLVRLNMLINCLESLLIS